MPNTHLFSDNIISFLSGLTIDIPLPQGVAVLNPYRDHEVLTLCKAFYSQYYSDASPRKLIIGINPGRMGGGLTGIPFIDPIKLETICGIPNTLQKKAELSADFIYKIIEAFGGASSFYQQYYFSSVSPLGFTRDGKNMNYYDDKNFASHLMPFILSCLRKQLGFGLHSKTAYCLGEGENYKFISKLNDQHNFFEAIIPLPHPRFLMQYKRKSLNQYIDLYLTALTQSS